MPLPELTAAQIEWVIQQVAVYIERQRLSFRRWAAPLRQTQKTIMASFFPESTLHSARIVMLRAIRVGNPPFYEELVEMGSERGSLPDFDLMAAVTFLDTIVSHVPFTIELLFHELVHVVQYERLGLAGFAAKYVRGFLGGGSYEAIPLEMNANQLVARFSAAPTKPFLVGAEVQSWIDAGKF